LFLLFPMLSKPAQCPLYPRKRTWISTVVMSAKGQFQTHAPQQNDARAVAWLFDHLMISEGPRSEDNPQSAISFDRRDNGRCFRIFVELYFDNVLRRRLRTIEPELLISKGATKVYGSVVRPTI